MTSKLTLTVEKTVIEKAKSYARKTDRSLSELVEKYLENLILEDTDAELTPKLSRIVGSITLPENFDEKEELQKYFEEKEI